jgi:hypothetical protein
MSSTPSATRESQRLLAKASKSQDAEKDDVIPRKRKDQKKDQRQQANEDPAPEQQQQKDTNQITNTATASTDTIDSTNTSPASVTATQRSEKKKKGREQQGSASNTRKKSGGQFSKKENRQMGKGTEPYSFHGNHPALSGSESDAVIDLLGGSDDEQPTVSDVLTYITMEDYTATNIDDVGVAT